MKLIATLIVLALTLAVRVIHAAEVYPDRTIHVIVPYPPAGGTDVATRWIAEKLSERLKQSVIVDNRVGAGGNMGTDAIFRATPDGYTIGVATPSAVTIRPSLDSDLSYDPLKDLIPIVLINTSPLVLVVNPALPVQSVKDLAALAKRTPGKLNAAHSGVGGVPHLLTELFKLSAGINIVNVPYNGGSPAAIAVMGGQVDILFGVMSVVLPAINVGKLRALAVTSVTRSPLIPDVPTMGEAGYPEVVGDQWNGIVAPAGVSPAIVTTLNTEINKILAAPDTVQRFRSLGMEPGRGTPDDFAAALREDSKRWAHVIRASNIEVK